MQRSNSITMKKITSPPPPLDKKPQKPPKLSSKLTHWPSNAEERKKLYNKYCASKERLSYQFLELMIKGEDIFKGVTKQIFKRAYVKADEIGSSQTATHGTITRRKFPYFLKYLLYFTDLWKVFDKMDNDKTTKLSLDKFTRNRAALDKDITKQRAEEIYREMDKDGSGSVGFDDFCNWLLRQPKVLHYDNQKFFTVDFSNANEDEDPGDLDVSPKEAEMKEEVKEEEDEAVEEINEIDLLRARVRELEEEVRNLMRELVEGRNSESNQELQISRKLIQDLEANVERSEQAERDLYGRISVVEENSNKRERGLNEEWERKMEELKKCLNNELTNKENAFNEKERKLNSEWEQKLANLKINLENKIIEQDNKYKLLLESESELKKSIEKQLKENEQQKIQIEDLKRNLQESIGHEQNLKSELDKILGVSPDCLVLRTLLQEEHKGIMVLELNDFLNKNTLSSQLVIELSRSIDCIKRNTEVRCVILKSKLPGIFCAGSALKEYNELSNDELCNFNQTLRTTFDAFYNLEVPTIFSIDGPALGLALEFALTADIRIASKSVILGPKENSFGLLSEAGGTQRLLRLIGMPLAKELVFTGRTLSSQEALQCGIINYVEESGESNFSKSIEIAKQICQNGTIAVKMAKEAMNYGGEHDLRSGLRVEKSCYRNIVNQERKEKIELMKTTILEKEKQ